MWAELQVPRGGSQGLAQVVAELTSLDGQVAAKASQVVALRTDVWSLRWVATDLPNDALAAPVFPSGAHASHSCLHCVACSSRTRALPRRMDPV